MARGTGTRGSSACHIDCQSCIWNWDLENELQESGNPQWVLSMGKEWVYLKIWWINSWCSSAAWRPHRAWGKVDKRNGCSLCIDHSHVMLETKKNSLHSKKSRYICSHTYSPISSWVCFKLTTLEVVH
jgi:hypothetical protein